MPKKEKLIESIFVNYETFREKSVEPGVVKHAQLLNYLEKLDKTRVYVDKAGASIEGRDIFYLKIGTGITNILMWTQMHGDEPTATLAVFDLLNFLTHSSDYGDMIKNLLSEVTLHIVPMLNPDGAEIHSRRNAAGIDINRDAVRLQSPEAKILMRLYEKIDPEFAFNLHDQDSGYSAGYNYKAATISLLAPPFDQNESMSPARENAMKICLDIFDEMSNRIPGHIAKYDEEFEPRAFGDNFVKAGTSTVLIEAGGWNKDNERDYVRKLYFTALLKGIFSVAEKSYLSKDLNDYTEIPLNKELLFDLVLRNLVLKKFSDTYKVDIAIKRERKFDISSNTLYYEGMIEDIGDLSIYYGYDEIDMDNYEIVESGIIKQNSSGENPDVLKFLYEGSAYVKIDKTQNSPGYTKLPINFFCSDDSVNTKIRTGNLANFFLKKNDELIYAVINGFLIDLRKEKNFTGNGLMLK